MLVTPDPFPSLPLRKEGKGSATPTWGEGGEGKEAISVYIT